MPLRSFFNYSVKIWSRPYNFPFAIGWGVVFVGAAMIPVTEADKKESPIYRRYYIKDNGH
eukprot:CAMPEP_0185255324 /NCGR_PEP_ID=MMETSP1359-20130426/4343_1 /TAXON_ID=552665 /ORGANISM="Bigelowiella longifila, Strain CCMP242" /LENGTH=59 /DNA_ID=CAMNT_0027839113 /DNA_START=204 /DNA_END=383 /DNA_ORIENTATION=+